MVGTCMLLQDRLIVCEWLRLSVGEEGRAVSGSLVAASSNRAAARLAGGGWGGSGSGGSLDRDPCLG